MIAPVWAIRLLPYAAVIVIALSAALYVYNLGRSHEKAIAKAKIEAIKTALIEKEREFNQILEQSNEQADNIDPTPNTDAELNRLCQRSPSCRDRK